MIINMTTVASRQKHYIDRTLESLFQSDGRDIPLNLILGSSDTSHVERYRNVATLVAWDEEAESQARQENLRHKCNVNAIRALRYGDDEASTSARALRGEVVVFTVFFDTRGQARYYATFVLACSGRAMLRRCATRRRTRCWPDRKANPDGDSDD